EVRRPSAELRPRLHLPLVLEGRLFRAQHLAHRVPRYPQLPRHLPDRLALQKVLAPYPTDRLHRQHPPRPAFCSIAGSASCSFAGGQFWTPIPPVGGSKLHAESQLPTVCTLGLPPGSEMTRRRLRRSAAEPGHRYTGRCVRMSISEVRVRWTGHFPAISMSLALCASVSGPATSRSTSIRSIIPSRVSHSLQSAAWILACRRRTVMVSSGHRLRRA